MPQRKKFLKRAVCFFIFIFLYFYIFIPSPALAQRQTNVYFFYGDGCPHCAKEENLLKKLETKYTDLKVQKFEVWKNKKNQKLLFDIAKRFQLQTSAVPITIIGNQTIYGYLNDESSGGQIENAINVCQAESCPDPIAAFLASRNHQNNNNELNDKKNLPDKIKLPLFGEINLKTISLPLLSVFIGAVDGFNPCAMWVLIFLITLLFGMQNRKRMWLLGGSFIGASALVYFLFLTAWLNVFLFLGFIVWVRVLIGLVALATGVYHLREYYVNRQAVCKVSNSEKQKKIFEKLKAITQKRQLWLALCGIILLAFTVNLVELVCSAGLPAVYTQVLAMMSLPGWLYYLYLLIYIFFFMLDDIVVFVAAMITLRVAGFSGKYSRFSNLIGGIVMLIIGLLLLFKPSWLMFG